MNNSVFCLAFASTYYTKCLAKVRQCSLLYEIILLVRKINCLIYTNRNIIMIIDFFPYEVNTIKSRKKHRFWQKSPNIFSIALKWEEQKSNSAKKCPNCWRAKDGEHKNLRTLKKIISNFHTKQKRVKPLNTADIQRRGSEFTIGERVLSTYLKSVLHSRMCRRGNRVRQWRILSPQLSRIQKPKAVRR